MRKTAHTDSILLSATIKISLEPVLTVVIAESRTGTDSAQEPACTEGT